VLLLIIFMGMGRIVLSAVLGRPTAPGVKNAYREGYLRGAPVLISLLLILLLGLYLPPPLLGLLNHAGTYLGMKP
ncbi:MAG: proton-conducting transporter membrane subunit, partial [Phycisphaerae bacterium]